MRSALPSAVSCEGKQGNPSLSPAYFRTACRFPQSRAKTVPKRLLFAAGLVFTRCEAFFLHTGRHRGAQGGVLHLRHEWGLVDFFAVQIIGEDFRFFLCCELP